MKQETAELRLQIVILWQMSYPDRYIVQELNKHGFNTSLYQVEKVRKKLGYIRRMTSTNRAEADKQLWDLVRQELDNGEIEGYGKELLQKWFRKAGYITNR